MHSDNEVLFEELKGIEGDVGLMTLNRPQVLNSLNHSMILAMHEQLRAWEAAPHIKAVIICAAPGRAFCAGGDLRFTYDRFKQHDLSLADFFRDEYQLNQYIYHYPKPYIALLNGITMGGGVGISIHGSHRIATEQLIFAMPETGIGFFPDVGGTYFLPRLPYLIGYYIGLTGIKLTSDDCVALGIAQQKISQDQLPELIYALVNSPLYGDKKQAVTEIIQPFQISCDSSLMDDAGIIETCFSKLTVEDILAALHDAPAAMCQEAAHLIKKKSPTSLKVSLRAMQEGKLLEFDACMQQEYRLTCRFLQGHDVAEGIRAVIVDKDHTPMWQPATLDKVMHDDVQSYFSSF